MTDDKDEAAVMAAHQHWQSVIADTLMPLISQIEDGKGIGVMRVFYTLRHEDGANVSAGQIGITPNIRVDESLKLVDYIIDLLLDVGGNNQTSFVDAPTKS